MLLGRQEKNRSGAGSTAAPAIEPPCQAAKANGRGKFLEKTSHHGLALRSRARIGQPVLIPPFNII